MIVIKRKLIQKVFYPDTGFMNAVNLFDTFFNFRWSKPFCMNLFKSL